jgi:hypothetical protein
MIVMMSNGCDALVNAEVNRPVPPGYGLGEAPVTATLPLLILFFAVIERSNAVYYSRPVIVQRASNTFRFRID